MNYSSKIYLNIEKFFFSLVLLMPLALISGPALPNIIKFLVVLYFVYIFFKKKVYFSNKNYIYVFFIFCSYLILRSLFLVFENDVDLTAFLYSFKSSFFYFFNLIFSFGVALLVINFKKFKFFFISITIITLLFLFVDTIYQTTTGYNFFGMQLLQARPSSLFGKELILGSFSQKILMTCIVTCYFCFDGKKFNILFFFLSCLGTSLIILSGERSALLLWILFIFLISFFIPSNYKLKIINLLLIILIIIGVIFTNKKAKNRYVEELRYHFTFEESQEYKIFSRGHSNHISVAMKMFKENVLFGQGPNLFRIKCHEKKFYTENGCSAHPHNIYAQLLAEVGIVGFLIPFFLFLYLSFLIVKEIFYNIFYAKKILYDYMFLIVPIYIIFWPIITTGSFYNSWVNNIYYFMFGIIIAFHESKIIKVT